MPISDKQLRELAEEYLFDVDGAKEFLGVEVKHRGRPKKVHYPSVPGSTIPKVVPPESLPSKPKKAAKPKKDANVKAASTSSQKRGPSGYNLYMSKSNPDRGKKWKELSESKRGEWNKTAASRRGK
jgi:hypothetical protein